MDERSMSLRPANRYLIWIYLSMVLILLSVYAINAISVMEAEGHNVIGISQKRIEDRVGVTVHLLESLAQDEWIRDPNVSYAEKAAKLAMYSDRFGYMMICPLDKDLVVYDEKGPAANLSGRDYLQRLYSTGRMQITDAFAAGSDGKTLNVTIAVPILKDNQVDGSLFAAIYFKEITDVMQNSVPSASHELLLFGRDTQVLNGESPIATYGETYLQYAANNRYMGTSVKEIEEKIYNKTSGDCWAFNGLDLQYISFVPIKNTEWMLFCGVSFWQIFWESLPMLAASLAIMTMVFGLLIYLERRFIQKRMNLVNMLLQSVQELEKKIYQNERPDDANFKEIIQLTSKGLTDGLTGAVTRTVFLDQIGSRMQQARPGKLSILCFVDVDDLKMINDTYGHEAGDMALKNVGYVLRKFEKLYDGMIGRYGGDEFLVYLTGFDDREAVEELLDELTISLKIHVAVAQEMVHMHCSVGAAITGNADLDTLMKRADEALYTVKRNGKGHYRLFESANQTNELN